MTRRLLPALATLPLLLGACASGPSLPTSPLPLATVPPAAPEPSAGALLAEARALSEAGDLGAARAVLEDALAAAPARDDVRLELAELLLTEGRELDRAGELLAGVRKRTVDARWDLASAVLAELRGDLELAQASYGRALMLGEDPDVRLRRAHALERLGRLEDAARELERARAARPRDAAVRSRLAELYESAGRLSEAEAELLGVARSEPGRAAGWTRLARFYERNGREVDAERADARARQAGRPTRTLRPLLPSRR